MLDTTTNSIIATLSVGILPKDAAITPDGTRGYVTNLDDPSVTVFDPATNAVIASVLVSEDDHDFSDGIAVTSDGTQVYVSTASNEILRIATETNSVSMARRRRYSCP